ncbi:succinylglutamate desuccinylase [Aquimarina sp. MAR_2010_214]|uniref:succinylglutamate desuccinylase/aspartoacylase family protein n=1 Tax=Aquimarina sp. MAR_2010_214 TaxID=1250026 RepID=UPI000C70123C|nr:succinylglutamate desuccinylase/aspartoacylase family protein [Aquimarina sp. MAR_2010_214]PKV51860.1 succinylglutamate desuccinylase [Aquimarina sp. MAR_2010_214]
MVQVYSKALDQSIETERIIGSIKGSQSGPTLIFIAGIHGNEPAGIFALRNVLDTIKNEEISIKGNIYAISGNLPALARGERYQKEDLNRLWEIDRIKNLPEDIRNTVTNLDIEQQYYIHHTIKDILNKENGPFYFMDLHTTSSKTIPFLTVNDSLLNRKYTIQYPIPMILGIEEYLDGPLLSYINELGYVSFGFEGGQHDDIAAIQNHISFIYLTMVFAGSVTKNDIDYTYHYDFLNSKQESVMSIYEIYWRYQIKEDEVFKMKPGFVNFQHIQKGEQLAHSNGKTITASKNGRIFMPLYQNQGNDGFFAIHSVHPIFLKLSTILRKAHFDNIFTILPGVRWTSNKKNELMVNLKIARFFTKQFFHLLGYRSKQVDKTHLSLKNRESASREKEYRYTSWSKSKNWLRNTLNQ